MRLHLLLAGLGVFFLLLASGCLHGNSCKPQQVHGFQGTCTGREGYVWNGSSCVWGRACNCTGPDCDSVYSSEDACGTAHIHCRR